MSLENINTSSKSLEDLIKPEFAKILENREKYDPVDIYNATKQENREKELAAKAGMTVEEYRQENYNKRQQLSKLTKEKEQQSESLASVDLKEFGVYVLEQLSIICMASGNKFKFHDEETKQKYADIIRYFWDPTECKTLYTNKNIYLYGIPGDGKTTLLKAINLSLKHFRGDSGAWHYFNVPTIMNKCLEAESIAPFNVILKCTGNMILDEIGDVIETDKLFSNPLSRNIRLLLMDKYEKWTSHSKYRNFQRIACTSNLFPDNTHFYTQLEDPSKDTRPTFKSFYGTKVYQRLEMFNLVRFPNVVHRKLSQLNFDL